MIHLEKYSTNNRVAFLAWMRGDPSSLAFIAKSCPAAAANPEALFAFFEELGRADSVHVSRAIEGEHGEILGHLELKRTSKVHDGELELVYVVRSELRNRGVATHAVGLAMAEAGGDSPSGIVAFINPRNIASQRVVEKVGFVVDGVTESVRRYRLPWKVQPPVSIDDERACFGRRSR